MKYDLVVFGGGTSGVAAAYTASKLGINTLLVEKSDVLGGSITQGLVVPAMKLDDDNINTDFYKSLLEFSKKYDAQHTYIDGNTGWFNYELLKIVFDDMLKSVNCTILFSTTPSKCSLSFSNKLFHLVLKHKLLSLHIETKYIVDATSNGEIFKLLNCKFHNSDFEMQSSSLRFTMEGIKTKDFANWLLKLDKDRNVTTAELFDNYAHVSTAYTWDSNKKWALHPLFTKAIEDGVLEEEDCAYFQLFTIPSMPNAVTFNAPRIILEEDENILDPFVYSRALIQGRERVLRIANFCKKYLKGFENSYISHISDILGVRESYRVKCEYTLSVDDIINPKKFDNIAFASNYPIDIHSNKKNSDKLEFSNSKYYVPIECLISADYDNLYAAGRIISADFQAQAAVRTQINCFSMGEAAAKDIAKKINKN